MLGHPFHVERSASGGWKAAALYSVGWVSLQGHNNVASLSLRAKTCTLAICSWFAAVAYVFDFCTMPNFRKGSKAVIRRRVGECLLALIVSAWHGSLRAITEFLVTEGSGSSGLSWRFDDLNAVGEPYITPYYIEIFTNSCKVAGKLRIDLSVPSGSVAEKAERSPPMKQDLSRAGRPKPLRRTAARSFSLATKQWRFPEVEGRCEACGELIGDGTDWRRAIYHHRRLVSDPNVSDKEARSAAN